MIAEKLRRMRDYRIDATAAKRYTSIGTINGWVKLPASFTPRRRSKEAERQLPIAREFWPAADPAGAAMRHRLRYRSDLVSQDCRLYPSPDWSKYNNIEG